MVIYLFFFVVATSNMWLFAHLKKWIREKKRETHTHTCRHTETASKNGTTVDLVLF